MAQAPQEKETRFFRASVRRLNAQGAFYNRIFACEVPVTGSYHLMAEAAITDINVQGWEVQHIITHSTKRDCV